MLDIKKVISEEIRLRMIYNIIKAIISASKTISYLQSYVES